MWVSISWPSRRLMWVVVLIRQMAGDGFYLHDYSWTLQELLVTRRTGVDHTGFCIFFAQMIGTFVSSDWSSAILA